MGIDMLSDCADFDSEGRRFESSVQRMRARLAIRVSPRSASSLDERSRSGRPPILVAALESFSATQRGGTLRITHHPQRRGRRQL